MRSIAVVVFLCMLHAVCGSVRIEKLEQKLDLRSHLATLTEVVSFKDATDSVVLCYPIHYYENAAYIKFTLKNDASSPLTYLSVDAHQPANHTCLSVALGSDARSSGQLESTLVMANLQKPTPAVIAQGQDQIVTFSGVTHAVSPYPIASQRLTVTLPSSDLKEHTRTLPVTAAGSRVTYGPYSDTPPFAVEPLQLRFKNHSPFLRIVRLDRDVIVSHWGRVNVEERYVLQHAGANLTRQFSRLEYMAAAFGGGELPVIAQLAFALPRRAQHLYFKDTIGNISSSNVRYQSTKTTMLARPRFPLMGGWRTEFTIGYSLPLDAVVKKRASEGGYLLTFGFVPPIEQGYIADEVTTSVVVPEGSRRMTLVGGPAFDGTEQSSTYTYLDTFGRPTLKLYKRHVVKEHDIKVHIAYGFSNIYLLQEPFLVTAAVFLIFAATMAISRVDLTIAKGAEWKAAQQKEKEMDALTELSAVVSAFNKHMASLAHAAETAAPGDAEGALAKLDAAKSAAKSTLDDMKSLQENLQGLSTAAAAAAAALVATHAAWLTASEKAHTSLVNGVGSGMTLPEARKRLQEQLNAVEQLQADAAAEAASLLADC